MPDLHLVPAVQEAQHRPVLLRQQHPGRRLDRLGRLPGHQHGVFWPTEGAETLVALEDGGAVLYVDEVTTAGRMVVTCLDPIAHFGSYFMPATERFPDGFLPWVKEELLVTSGRLPAGRVTR